jgi:poly(3-hydroxybutyrate) depolymerase
MNRAKFSFLFSVMLVFAWGVAVLPSVARAGEATIVREDKTMKYKGETREYIVFAPSERQRFQRFPVVAVLHGGEGDVEKAIRATNMEEYLRANPYYIAVFPRALPGHQWNDGRAETNSGADDAGFIRTVAAAVALEYGGIAERMYLAYPTAA